MVCEELNIFCTDLIADLHCFLVGKYWDLFFRSWELVAVGMVDTAGVHLYMSILRSWCVRIEGAILFDIC